ncbi:MAG: phosphonate ABC transporter ATP-binding protein [Thermosynechococcaceae cyanobacterium]
MNSPLFHADRISYQFGALTALSEIKFSIDAGERVALIGPSGAGKSTLLNLLNGTLVPSTGQITILGSHLGWLRSQSRRRIQRQIGTIYQQHHLVPQLSVIHNINAGHLGRWSLLKAAGSLLWPQQVDVATQVLKQVGLDGRLYNRTDQLSGGQQQRVALARVLVQNPLAILADEPIASLDPARSHDLMALLRNLTETTGKTLVVSLHDIEFAFEYCTRLLGLRQGRLLFDAPPAQVTDKMIESLYQLSNA